MISSAHYASQYCIKLFKKIINVKFTIENIFNVS